MLRLNIIMLLSRVVVLCVLAKVSDGFSLSTSTTTTTTTTTPFVGMKGRRVRLQSSVDASPFRRFHRQQQQETVPSSSSSPLSSPTTTFSVHEKRAADEIRQEWIENSVVYYSKVMREERRRSAGQYKEFADPNNYKILAKKHYFALRKIKDGKPEHAERIYRRIINELLNELRQEEESNAADHCDHSKLAVTTLLLALHLQRNNASPKKTRSVFLNFFRIVTSEEHANDECACSAKVLQAFALFEMKQGNALKSLELAKAAIKLDPTLHSVLNWKQFRDAMERRIARSSNKQPHTQQ